MASTGCRVGSDTRVGVGGGSGGDAVGFVSVATGEGEGTPERGMCAPEWGRGQMIGGERAPAKFKRMSACVPLECNLGAQLTVRPVGPGLSGPGLVGHSVED